MPFELLRPSLPNTHSHAKIVQESGEVNQVQQENERVVGMCIKIFITNREIHKKNQQEFVKYLNKKEQKE